MPDVSLPETESPDKMIIDEDDREFKSWVTAEVKDSEGHIVSLKETVKHLSTLLKRGSPLSVMHTNHIVGRMLNFEIRTHPLYDVEAPIGHFLIYKNYPTDDKVWADVKAGKYKGFSIGGDMSVPDAHGNVDQVYPVEISLAEKPRNPAATMQQVSMAKADTTDQDNASSNKACSKKGEKIMTDEEKPKVEPAKEELAKADEAEVKPIVNAPGATAPNAVAAKPEEVVAAKADGDGGLTLEMLNEKYDSLAKQVTEIRDMIAKSQSTDAAATDAVKAEEAKPEEELKPEEKAVPEEEETKEDAVKEMKKSQLADLNAASNMTNTPRPAGEKMYAPNANKPDEIKQDDAMAIATGMKTYNAKDYLAENVGSS